MWDLMPNHRLGPLIFSHGFDFYFKFYINLSANISSTVLVKSTEGKSVVNNSRKPQRKAQLALAMQFNLSKGKKADTRVLPLFSYFLRCHSALQLATLLVVKTSNNTPII